MNNSPKNDNSSKNPKNDNSSKRWWYKRRTNKSSLKSDQTSKNRESDNWRDNKLPVNHSLNSQKNAVNVCHLESDQKDNKNTYYKNNRYSNTSNSNCCNSNEKLNFDTILFNSINKLISEMDDSKNNPIIKNITIKRISRNSDNNLVDRDNLHLLTSSRETNIINSNEDKKEEQKEEFILDITKEYDELDVSLNSLDSLIELGKKYNPATAHKYAINLKRLNTLVPTLEKLQSIIGMNTVKTAIVNQIIYFMSAFESNDNMLHTVITGPPGVGKTMLGQIIGEIYYNLGIIKGSSDKSSLSGLQPSASGNENKYPFKIARRSDLIGQYLGQTAVKTQKIIDECEGGVLFIDEAYSLGSGSFSSSEKSDIYSKECLDTINLNLTEKKKNFVCIIAGYPESLDKDFFSVNPGLKRRFPFTYNIEKYTADELANIFQSQMSLNTWSFESDAVLKNLKTFLTKNYESFPNFGGDMETLFFNVKIAHALRVVCKHPSNRKKITIDDIESGFKFYKLAKVKKDTNLSQHLYGIYS